MCVDQLMICYSGTISEVTSSAFNQNHFGEQFYGIVQSVHTLRLIYTKSFHFD